VLESNITAPEQEILLRHSAELKFLQSSQISNHEIVSPSSANDFVRSGVDLFFGARNTTAYTNTYGSQVILPDPFEHPLHSAPTHDGLKRVCQFAYRGKQWYLGNPGSEFHVWLGLKRIAPVPVTSYRFLEIESGDSLIVRPKGPLNDAGVGDCPIWMVRIECHPEIRNSEDVASLRETAAARARSYVQDTDHSRSHLLKESRHLLDPRNL
jgi:hypothetical protein